MSSETNSPAVEHSPFDGEGRLVRRLRQAVDHVSHLWFPVNESHYERILSGLKNGVYDLDIDFLIQDVRKDFSLFMFCVRELSLRAIAEGRSLPQDAAPAEILRFSGLAALKLVLSTDLRKISIHSLSQSSESQTFCIRDAMIAASTAEVLAGYAQVEPLQGYSGALLRQLGLTLIAWNYPTVFRKVMQGLEKREISDIDAAFSQMLGFSPKLLGTALAHEWKLPQGSLVALNEVDDADKKIAGIGVALRKICEVGEALARANSPEVYPTARADWDHARNEIQARLGQNGFELLQARAKENCEQYIKAIPETFKTIADISAEAKLHAFEEESLYERNPFIKFLPPLLRKQFKEVYEQIDLAKVSRDTLRIVLKEIVPAAGFSGGVIYTVDPGINALVPRTKILEVYGHMPQTIPLQGAAAPSEMVLAAFRCSTPIVETLDKVHEITAVATVLGDKQRVGVLYLETLHELKGEEGERQLLALKAVRSVLAHCLKLE